MRRATPLYMILLKKDRGIITKKGKPFLKIALYNSSKKNKNPLKNSTIFEKDIITLRITPSR
jgi:hypothetical protein